MGLIIFSLALLAACAPGVSPTPGGPPPGKGPEPVKPPALPGGPDQETAVTLAKQALAARLQIGADQIALVSVENVTWPDTSLGLPKPGMFYAQVIVPGFRIRLSARGQTYLYHAGKLGEKMTVLAAD